MKTLDTSNLTTDPGNLQSDDYRLDFAIAASNVENQTICLMPPNAWLIATLIDHEVMHIILAHRISMKAHQMFDNIAPDIEEFAEN